MIKTHNGVTVETPDMPAPTNLDTFMNNSVPTSHFSGNMGLSKERHEEIFGKKTTDNPVLTIV